MTRTGVQERPQSAPLETAPETASSMRCVCGALVLRITCVDGGLLDIDPVTTDDGVVLAVQVDGQVLARLRSIRHDPPTSGPSWHRHQCRDLAGWASRRPARLPSPLPLSEQRCLGCGHRLPAVVVDLALLTHPTCDPDDTRARAAVPWSTQTYLAVMAADATEEDT